MNATNISSKKRILCIADLPNWIFNRHIETLRRFLSDEFEIVSGYRYEPFIEADFDLIYPLEHMLVEAKQIQNPIKYVTAIRSWVSWADREFLSFTDYLNTHFQRVHVISDELLGIFSPYLDRVELLQNGVDLDFFAPEGQQNAEAGKIRLGWAGRRDTFIKGLRDYIQPLEDLPGVELKFCGYIDRNLTLEEMPGFYSEIDAYICASSFEGHNNSIMEAAAMERAIITTRVGTVGEYLNDGESALIVDRDPECFKMAVVRLRDDPELRMRLGKEARLQLERLGWDWKLRAEEFRRFFREAIQLSGEPRAMPTELIKPPKMNQDHLFAIFSSQNQLLREMRNGDWELIMGQKTQISAQESQIEELRKLIRSLEAEIIAIRDSESYRLIMRIGSNPIFRGLIKLYKRLFGNR